MKLENREVRLELAKEMKELGVPQNSIFGWYQYKGYDPHIEYNALERRESYERSFVDGYSEDPTLLCSAPTVAELGEMLPEGYFSQKDRGSWSCANPDNTLGVSNIYDCDNLYSEADARAKMIIYLIKAGIIKAKEIGK